MSDSLFELLHKHKAGVLLHTGGVEHLLADKHAVFLYLSRTVEPDDVQGRWYRAKCLKYLWANKQ